MTGADFLKPTILSEGKNSPDDLALLRSSAKIWKEADVYESQLKELFEITHPESLKSPDFKSAQDKFVRERTAGQETALRGSWIYFPWSGILAHAVSEQDYFSLRTNRNRNLIALEEQEKLRDACVAIVGLSVGSNIATALAYAGISRRMKLAEFDTLETTNLNRIRARIDQIGMLKIDIALEQIYDVDPYAELSRIAGKIDKNSLSDFVLGDPKPRIIFEIIDSFEMKIYLRELAREHGIPVIMVTNLGDRVLLDVERYDLDKNTQYFNGRAGSVPSEILGHPDVTDADKHKYAVELAGVRYIPRKAMESVSQIGKTLVGRPQLASTVTVAGGVCSYFARKIILGEPLPSCSWLVDLDLFFTKENAL